MTDLSDYADAALDLLVDFAGESVDYTVVGTTNTTSAITMLALEQQYAITDDKENKKFVVRSSDLAAPARGDLITEASGDQWSVLDIQSRVQGAFFLLFGIKPQERS